MKRLLSLFILTGLLLISTGPIWALPITDTDTVQMTVVNGQYTMTNMDLTGDWQTYQSFCVERTEYFNPGGIYDVDSVAGYANEGGGSAEKGATLVSGVWQDPVDDYTTWLYASYFEGTFDSFGSDAHDMVQNAIWLNEDEFLNGDSGLEDALTDNLNLLASVGIFDSDAFDLFDFSVEGWDIQVINLSQNGDLKQSQLVGAPVPEPQTMILFGIGLISLAGIGRKKIIK